MTARYPCPACGFVVFVEPPGSYAICPLCRWEDDQVQLETPGYAGGANHRSLFAHQREVALTRAPLGVDLMEGYRRAPDWRPLTPEESPVELPSGRADPSAPIIYYWRRSRPAI